MGRGSHREHEPAPSLRSAPHPPPAPDDEPAEVVSVTLWIKRSLPEPQLVDIDASASGYDAELLNDYDIAEAGALEARAVPFSLETLLAVLDRDLARALARELDVPYEDRSGIAP